MEEAAGVASVLEDQPSAMVSLGMQVLAGAGALLCIQVGVYTVGWAPPPPLASFGLLLVGGLLWALVFSYSWQELGRARRLALHLVRCAPGTHRGIWHTPHRVSEWMADSRHRRWLLVALGVLGGAIELGLLAWGNVLSAYPWDVLSFGFGFSTGLVLGETVMLSFAYLHLESTHRDSSKFDLETIGELKSTFKKTLQCLALIFVITHVLLLPVAAGPLPADWITALASLALGFAAVLSALGWLLHRLVQAAVRGARREQLAQAQADLEGGVPRARARLDILRALDATLLTAPERRRAYAAVIAAFSTSGAYLLLQFYV